ncbi:MAG TPA: ferric reductase-like transmembrane domain-containing protein [Flavisolibacter sp.]|jgi:predicted ferric reductase|nr:ferric reductase-like transmembrane domain-containing protein [Flavisolibacter sp.]
MAFDVVEISSLLGLFALLLLTFNFLLGILLSTGYKRWPLWKKMPPFIRNLRLQFIHNWTAYAAFFLLLAHPLLLLLDASTKFQPADIFIPFHSGFDPLWVGMGSISLYLIVLVILTTQKALKKRLGFRLWKNIHLISYVTALLICLHGIVLNPHLKHKPVDYLDGEKLVCEACLLILLLAGLWRLRYHRASVPSR